MAFLSGPAITAAILRSLGPGAHLLSVNGIYSGTRHYTNCWDTRTGCHVSGFGNGCGRNYYRANTEVRTHHVFLTIQVLINDIVNMDNLPPT
jgi:cystathionine beta-lyase/cystathionine gamma-synthase